MSHDRGCHCGREKYEYDDCHRPDCIHRPGNGPSRKTRLASIGVKEERVTAKEDHDALMNQDDNTPRRQGVVADRDGRPDNRAYEIDSHHQRSIPELMQELEARENPDLEKDSGDLFLEHLDRIAAEDAAGLKAAQLSYGNSWKSRGGVGAFMMLARKWDRLENRVKRMGDILNRSRQGRPNLQAQPYDIFQHIATDLRAEGIIDDVRDLRRYLMLVEAEMRARGFDATHRDNK